jgi:hypothetical protein
MASCKKLIALIALLAGAVAGHATSNPYTITWYDDNASGVTLNSYVATVVITCANGAAYTTMSPGCGAISGFASGTTTGSWNDSGTGTGSQPGPLVYTITGVSGSAVGPATFSSGGGGVMTIHFGGPVDHIWAQTIHNATGVAQNFDVGVTVAGVLTDTKVSVAPNSDFTLNVHSGIGNPEPGVTVTALEPVFNPDGSPAGNQKLPIQAITPGQTGWDISNPPITYTGQPPSATDTTAQPITFSDPGSLGAAKEATLRETGNAVVTAQKDTTVTLGQDLGNLNATGATSNQKLDTANGYLGGIKSDLDKLTNSSGTSAPDYSGVLGTIAANTAAGALAGQQTRDAVGAGAAGTTNAIKSASLAEGSALSNLTAHVDSGFTNTINQLTNLFSSTNDAASRIASYGASSSNAASLMMQPVLNLKGALSPISVGSHDAGDWLVTIPMFGDIDLNPLHNLTIATMAAWVRNIETYLLWFYFVLKCWRCVEEHIRSLPSAKQTSSSEPSLIGSGISFLVAGFISVAFGVAVAAAMALLISNCGGIGALAAMLNQNPVASGNAVIGRALGLADAFIPLDLTFNLLVVYFSFRLTVSFVFTVATTFVRFMVA